MIGGAYTLAQNAHVRGDFLYSSMRPRTQAGLDLVLYIVFFLPGHRGAGLCGLGLRRAVMAHQRAFQCDRGRPAGLSFQGDDPAGRRRCCCCRASAEIARCVICLKTGVWPSRLKDVSEIDVVEEQLALSEHVDEEARRGAIDHAQNIEESARQRGMGGELQS